MPKETSVEVLDVCRRTSFVLTANKILSGGMRWALLLPSV